MNPRDCPPGVFLALPDAVGPGVPLAVKDLYDTAGLVTTYGSPLFAEHVPATTAPAVARARGRGLRGRRQDQPARVRVRNDLREPPLRRRAEPARVGTGRGRLERWERGCSRARRRRARARNGLRRLDPDTGRLLRRRRLQADVRARLPRGLLPARPELRPRRPDGTRRRGLRGRARRARLELRAARTRVARRGRDRRHVARRSRPARARAGRASHSALPASPAISLPEPEASAGSSCTRWPGSTRSSSPRTPTSTARTCGSRSSAVSRSRRRRPRRRRDTARIPRASRGAARRIDLVVTPTLPTVAPPFGAGGVGDLGVRETLISRTFPFNVLGWPALALPCGEAEDALPASVQLAGRPGADALVLAAGRLLEAALAEPGNTPRERLVTLVTSTLAPRMVWRRWREPYLVTLCHIGQAAAWQPGSSRAGPAVRPIPDRGDGRTGGGHGRTPHVPRLRLTASVTSVR